MLIAGGGSWNSQCGCGQRVGELALVGIETGAGILAVLDAKCRAALLAVN